MNEIDEANSTSPTNAKVLTDDKIIFEASSKPPRLKQLTAARFARILAAPGLRPLPDADQHRRAVFQAVVPLIEAVAPSGPKAKAAQIAALQAVAKRLRDLCKDYVRADPAARSQEPPFAMIGPLDHLTEWGERTGRLSKKSRGRKHNLWAGPMIAELERVFTEIYGQDAAVSHSPKAPFTKFVRACLQEIGDISFSDHWLRKADGK
jgi:hypothetical protein